MYKLILLFVTLFVNNVLGYNILVAFPYPGKSHAILGDGFVRHLLNAGHDVTYITAIPYKPAHPKLKQVDVSSNIAKFQLDKALDFETFLREGSPFTDVAMFYNVMQEIANNSIVHENVQKFIKESTEKFDVVIGEWLYSELYCGFGAVFNAPYIWSSSMEPHPAVLNLIDEPGNPAYFPDHMSPLSIPMSFKDRVKELWGLVKLQLIKRRMRDSDEKTFKDAFGPAAEKRGLRLRPLEEVKYEAALMFGNSHVSSGEAHKLPQNYIPISGYHIQEKIPPLSENWQKILDSSPNGVIYFSMGTMMKSKTMPREFIRAILKVFSELKQTVIWKFEEEMTDVPKNVHIVSWAPQQSILVHPNCVLFITHGGLLSTTETLHFGIPIIGIPLFADQHNNVRKAVNKGFALQIDLGYDTPAKLKETIHEILSNPKYREKVKELSFIYHHRPTKPGASIVHYVEHVIQTKGAPHLKSPATRVPLYQKMYLDLVALIVAAILLLVKLLYSLTSKKTASRKKKND